MDRGTKKGAITMPHFEFSKSARVVLSVEEEKFLKEFKQTVAQADLDDEQTKIAHTLVNKMVLYRKKKNGNLYYVKESKK